MSKETNNKRNKETKVNLMKRQIRDKPKDNWQGKWRGKEEENSKKKKETSKFANEIEKSTNGWTSKKADSHTNKTCWIYNQAKFI